MTTNLADARHEMLSLFIASHTSRDVAIHYTCTEAETIAAWIHAETLAAGEPMDAANAAADLWITEHAAGDDDPCDLHHDRYPGA
ncbi:hypothetical protein ACIQ00_10610 [Micrococcus luteus]|uniref:hypothetical protein n=1 Tax=Micrococcus luteus TaxID=1270 RepID=UPI003432A158